jgi:toxin ParE1/3/4
MRFVITDEARRDLGEIGSYSRRTWGDQQAREYTGLLLQAFARLTASPHRGRSQPRFGSGVRRLNVRRHAIFFFVRGDELVIARVLHQNMNITPDLFRGRGRTDDR